MPPACKPFLIGSCNLDYDGCHDNELTLPLASCTVGCVGVDLAVKDSVDSHGSVTSGGVLFVIGQLVSMSDCWLYE